MHPAGPRLSNDSGPFDETICHCTVGQAAPWVLPDSRLDPHSATNPFDRTGFQRTCTSEASLTIDPNALSDTTWHDSIRCRMPN